MPFLSTPGARRCRAEWLICAGVGGVLLEWGVYRRRITCWCGAAWILLRDDVAAAYERAQASGQRKLIAGVNVGSPVGVPTGVFLDRC